MQDDDEANARNEQMITQLVDGGTIQSSKIADAFRNVLRHWFLPGTPLDEVYRDTAVVTHREENGIAISSSSQPTIMARMLRQLEVEPGQRILEVGTGTGYNAALLAQLTGPEGEVVTVDVDPEICARAEHNLEAAGVRNVSVVPADAWTLGSGGGGFDRIEATVGVWDLAFGWVEQLKTAGILLVPLWLRAGLQASVAFRRAEGCLQSTSVEPCGFMRLRGPGAGAPAYEQIGDWTVSFDEPSQERAELLRRLLENEPDSVPAPPLPPGWFTPIALGEPDAVHLFSVTPEGPVISFGLLDATTSGLAVVVSQTGCPPVVNTFGSGRAREHLLRLIRSEAPVEVANLRIAAVPAQQVLSSNSLLATLRRPNFSFLVHI